MQYHVSTTIINDIPGKPFVTQAILTDNEDETRLYSRDTVKDNQRLFFIFDENDKLTAIFNDYDDAVKFNWHFTAVKKIHYLQKYKGKIDLPFMISEYEKQCKKYNIKPVTNWNTPTVPSIEIEINGNIETFDILTNQSHTNKPAKSYIFIGSLIVLSKNGKLHPFVSARHQLI